ncbi:DUF1559 domain-containing protein [Maioricimonas sp. JC845]|mgnify:CR=1 FL=1|uniref:DUF1559 domain-containing protein n=1 Tax=Maioricimonas sp. JC845 TaxID=3232138 RepID=UPI00345AB689
MTVHMRRGFTLIELLVAITILAILIALLLPAVQSAREAARRTRCSSRLSQLGLALHSYHDAHRALPINGTVYEPSASEYRTRSWLQCVLPDIDQKNLHDRIEAGSAMVDNQTAAETVVPLFFCPSDTHTGRTGAGIDVPPGWQVALTNYRSCAGDNWPFDPFERESEAGRFSGSNLGWGTEGNGVIGFGKGWPVLTRLSDVRDGASQTIALGETVVMNANVSWWFHADHSAATCAIPINHGLDVEDEDNWADRRGFMSRHPGGAQFVMVDGSVRMISESIEQETFYALGTIDGDEVVGDF